MADWLVRPLDCVYPVIFIDAIHVKVRDGQVANRAFYCAIGVTVDGKRDILGIWVSPGAEGAKFWLGVPHRAPQPRGRRCVHRGVRRPQGTARRHRGHLAPGGRADLVLHLTRGAFRYAGRQHWDAMARDMRPIYTAVNETDAKERMMEFFERWADRYPAVRQLWENAWAEFVPFLDYPPEVRRVIYSTNAIESLHARMRRATRARGHFPTEQAAMKCLYLVVRSLDPTGKGGNRWMNRWKPALNAFAITFNDRLFPTEQ
jgi:transposase-like protein